MLLEDTPAVLSLGKLCEDHGYTYHWTSGQQPHHIKDGRKIYCSTANYVPFRCPWSIDKLFKLIFTHFSYIFIEGNRRSEGFPHTRLTIRSCACDFGRGPVSVGAFFILSSFFFLRSSFFSHPESVLKIKLFVGKSDVSGKPWRGGMKTEKMKWKKMAKMKKWKLMKKRLRKNEKMAKIKKWKIIEKMNKMKKGTKMKKLEKF